MSDRINVYRGDPTPVSLEVLGNYSSSEVFFGAHGDVDRELSTPLLISIADGSITKNYNSITECTTFIFTIPKTDTQSLTNNRLYYDLVNFDTSVTLLDGVITLKKDVVTPYNGTIVPSTLLTSLITVERPSTSGVLLFNVSSLSAVYENTLAGDTVTVKGNHDLGDNSVQFKSGVNWDWRRRPTISSDSVLGTFSDNNIPVDVNFVGDVVITNSNGLENRIILQNSLSDMNGFCWIYRANISVGSGSNMVSIVVENTLGGIPVWTREGAGYWKLTLAGAFVGVKVFDIHMLVNRFFSIGLGNEFVYLNIAHSNDIFQIRTTKEYFYGANSPVSYDLGTSFKNFTLRIYPKST